MKPKDRDWHAGRRTKYENGFPWAKCPTLATGSRTPTFGAAPRSRKITRLDRRLAPRTPVVSRVSPVPKGPLSDGYPATPAVPLLLPIVIVTLTRLEIPVKSTGRAAALNT